MGFPGVAAFALGALSLAGVPDSGAPFGRASGRVSDTAWLTSGLELASPTRYRLAPEPTLALLGRYLRPWESHTPEWRAYRQGAYGGLPTLSLTWRMTTAPQPTEHTVLVSRRWPRWMTPRPVTIVRYAGESDSLRLFDCDGGIAPEVIDRLSILARAPGTPRPELPLPELPQGGHAGEWLPGVHLLDPRLVWAIGK